MEQDIKSLTGCYNMYAYLRTKRKPTPSGAASFFAENLL